MASSDIAALFGGSPNDTKSVQIRQGIVKAWNPSTGDNTINVGGATLTNLAFLIAEATVLTAGDVVQLISQGGKSYILGKVTDPGESDIVPQWPGDIANLNDVVVPQIQADVVTAQGTADSAAAGAAAAQAAADAAAAEAADALAAATTDGNPPASSPDAEVIGGYEIILTRWTPIVNADPVTYKVDISTTDGFTPDSTTLAGTTTASQFTIKSLPGDPPAAPDDPDLRVLQYGTTYYVKVTATDADGEASPGVQGSATVFQLTGANIAADTITGAQIAGGTITGDLLSGSVIVGGVFKTAEDGQRVEFGSAGIKGYKPDGSLMVSFPTEDGEEALYDGEMISRQLTVLGGASFQSTANEVTADASVTLMRGITSPSATPQVGVTYDAVFPSTASLSSTVKTNTSGLGLLDLVASEVSCIEWRVDLDCFSFYQLRPNGTREWYIDITGAPVDPLGDFYVDWVDWEIWSATELLGTGTPAKNGHYLMFRWMPSGSDYYCYSANGGLYRYSRQNGAAAPVMGNNGSDVYVAEVINSTHLNIRYFNLTGGSGNFPAAITAYESSQGFAVGQPLACVINETVEAGARYIAASRGVGTKVFQLVTNGTNANSIFPGSTSNNWGSANVDAETFEAPTANRRGLAWDGTQFWSYHGDGYLYKHTSERWDPAVSSSTYWSKVTFYDSDATGGTHETTPGPVKSYTAKRRSKNSFTAPSIPDNGGTDDPNQVKLYMARGSSAPSNSSYHLQYTGSVSAIWQTMATVTATPPTSNTFPSSNPATITNDDDTLVISGDGSGAFASLAVGGENVMTVGGNPQPVSTFSATANNGVTGTSFAAGTPVVGVAFTAPASGSVWVNVTGHLEQTIASRFGYLSFEMRLGATVGSGAVNHTAVTQEGVGVGQGRISASTRTLVTGLTPGDSYNVRTMHVATPSGSNVNIIFRTIVVEPIL